MNELLFFDFNQKSSLLLIFFFNAIVFSLLLFLRGFRDSRQDAKWLGLFTLLCGLYIAPFLLGYAGWYSIKTYREILFFLPLQQLFLIGPVIYFYTKSLLDKDFVLSKKELLHFLPAIGYLIYSLIIFIVDKLLLDEFYFYADGRDKDLDFWYQMAGLISMLYYLLSSLDAYRNYKNILFQEVSYANEVLFKWIRNFLLAFTIILILRILFFIVNPEWGEFGSKFWYYFSFSILFFYIAISGYANAVRSSVSLNPITSPSTVVSLSDTIDDHSTPDLEKWKQLVLIKLEEEKIYRKPNLTLTDLATILNTNRSLLSNIINQGFEMNFNDFINKKRIDAVIKDIQSGRHRNTTILGLALENGFNSKATFNRAFKKHTSLTPKQFIAKNNL